MKNVYQIFCIQFKKVTCNGKTLIINLTVTFIVQLSRQYIFIFYATSLPLTPLPCHTPWVETLTLSGGGGGGG